MLLTEDEAIKRAGPLAKELDARGRLFGQLESYYTGSTPIPPAIARAQVTQAYEMLMSFAQTNYGRLIVKAATSRMEVGGIRSGDKALDKQAWAVWQANRMDAESRLAHDSLLTHGRVFAIAWPETGREGVPDIVLEDAQTAIVEYVEGSRYRRAAALRRWVDDDKVSHCTLYLPDFIYKFSGPKDSAGAYVKWERRAVEGEPWPLPNTYDVVPVIELAASRRLKATKYGHAAGDFEHVVGLMDRINVLEFLRLVIAFTSGFPIRAVIGDKILYDDDKNPIAPFRLAADVIAQFENPDAKLQEIEAADLKSFGEAIDHDVETLAGITQTPAYYMRSVPIQNVSADAIRASDAPLNARVEDHKPGVGEGWEETLRTAGLMADPPFVLPLGAELVWVSRELRSLAERADAATKFATVLPWQAVAEIALDATQEQISRWEAARASDALSGLLTAPALNGSQAEPAPQPAPRPVPPVPVP